MSRRKKNAFYSSLFILWNRNELCIYFRSACNDKITTVQIVIMPFCGPDYKGSLDEGKLKITVFGRVRLI